MSNCNSYYIIYAVVGFAKITKPEIVKIFVDPLCGKVLSLVDYLLRATHGGWALIIPPPNEVGGGYTGITLSICLSVCLSVRL